MSWLDLRFRTPAQAEKDRRLYQSRLLPLGEEQQKAALSVLQRLTSPTLGDHDRLFAFFNAKQAYLEAADINDDPPVVPLGAALASMEGLPWLKARDRRTIAALVVLDASVKDLRHYPSADEVRELAGSLASR